MITEDDIQILKDIRQDGNFHLTAQEQLVIEAHYFQDPPLKLREISEQLGGVSLRRVCHILRNAKRKIRQKIQFIKEVEYGLPVG